MTKNDTCRVLILGASGMLGNALFQLFSQEPNFVAFGSVRSLGSLHLLPEVLHANVISGVDVENADSLTHLFSTMRPDIVINCVGLVKQLAEADDPLTAIPINALLPHRLARLCELSRARLIHMSTDCVFSGNKGGYKETDTADANDLYGRSKYLGECDYPHAVTLRTSIIGHELSGSRSLIGWFLAQKGKTKGFRRAVFSGLPTVEIGHIIRDHVIPNPDLHGLYHVSSKPISKFDLLTLVAQIYKKEIEIEPEDITVVDRSLNSMRFQKKTGYQPPGWPELVQIMHEFE
jgi:dTDP-4-dehydrorhamnose reductase